MQMRTQSKKHKIIRTVLLVILLLLIVAAGGFISVYEGRFQTISSIQKVTDYDEYNLYRMDVKYDYDLDRLIEYGITDNFHCYFQEVFLLKRHPYRTDPAPLPE